MAKFSVKVEIDEEKSQEMIEEFKRNNPNFVEVVRCAECRHFVCNLKPDGFLPEGVGETECTLFHCGTDYIDYCSYGEQKSGDVE